MNFGCFKNIDGEGSPYVTISLELTPCGPHLSLNWERKIHHCVFIFTSSKQRHIKNFTSWSLTAKKWIRNFYESSSVTVAPTRTIWSYLRLLVANVWFFYLFCHMTFNKRNTLRWCNRALLRLVRRQAEVKTRRLRFKPSSLLAINAFPAVSVNIYHWRFGPSMNHVSFLKADIWV